jgi:hypothetical protein
MRISHLVLALSAAATTQGCLGASRALEAIAPKCTQEQVVVTWPITITRGSLVTNSLQTATLTQTNIDRTQFDALRQALTEGGGAGTYNVTWTVSAFDVNGGYIALTHAAPLATGATQQVGVAFQGGGWGARPVSGPVAPAVAVRANDFVATTATGSITALASSPLRLRIDVTTANASGETIRLSGDAGFSYHKVVALCD